MRHERGSILFYILAAIFMAGLLTVSLTSGPKKSVVTGQLDELANLIYADLVAAEAAINDCVLVYPAAVDFDASGTADTADNPNPGFPLYHGLPWNAGTSYGAAGADLADITCAGAPGLPKIFDGSRGRGLRILGDTALWQAQYRNEATEGVMLRVTRTSPDPLWDEAAERINARYSACKAFAVKDGTVDGGACENGCLFLWLVRPPSSAIGNADGGGVTCP